MGAIARGASIYETQRVKEADFEVVRDTWFEYVVFTEKNSLFDPKVTKR